MSRWPAIVLALLWLLGIEASARGAFEQGSFEQGVDAYRRGAYSEAQAAWRAALEEPLDALSRARVYYDLGNAHWRSGESLPAIACYTAAVRLDPRHAEAWQNLEFARNKAGLPPADSGGLGATIERLLTRLRPAERRALLLAALVLWSLVLVLEARFGGDAWRTGLLVASGALALSAVPWAYGALERPRHEPMLAIGSGGVSLRAEPLEARSTVGELEPLEEVERLDELPGWVRIERHDGSRGWARSELLFPLRLANDG